MKVRKIKTYRICIAWKLFNRLLPDKQHFSDSVSRSILVSCGVLQGNVLGPLLFLIHTNDLFNVYLNFQVIFYADKTTIFEEADDFESLRLASKADIAKNEDWLHTKFLTLHTEELKFLIIRYINKIWVIHI